jgi:hypothetical protein
MEDTPIGFVVNNPSGRSTMTGSNKVSYKLIPPTNDSEPYKAIITVDSHSRYYVDRTPEATDEKDREKEADSTTDKALADSGDEKDPQAFDTSLSGERGNESTKSQRSGFRASDGPLPAQPHKLKRDYELVYENGRWTLVTKLNADTEQSVQFAFNNALDTQI